MGFRVDFCFLKSKNCIFNFLTKNLFHIHKGAFLVEKVNFKFANNKPISEI